MPERLGVHAAFAPSTHAAFQMATRSSGCMFGASVRRFNRGHHLGKSDIGVSIEACAPPVGANDSSHLRSYEVVTYLIKVSGRGPRASYEALVRERREMAGRDGARPGGRPRR